MRKVKRYLSGIIAILLLIASIPMNVFASAETVIVSQPEDQYVSIGGTATFTVEAMGDNLSYQWMFSNNGGESWTKSGAASAKTASYSFAASQAHDGRMFKCQVTGASGTVVSDIATLHIGTQGGSEILIVTQPLDQYGYAGNTVVFTVEATGENLAYQWLFSDDGGNNWTRSGAASAKTASYSFTASKAHNGRMFKCQITGANGTVISDIATFHIGTLIDKQPIDQNVEAGDTATFTIEATGENLTYQWYFSNNGGESWTKSGAASAKTASYLFAASQAHDGRMFKCQVTGTYGTVMSEVATLHIQEAIETVIETQPEDQYVKEGDTATFTVEAIGDNLTYQWLFSNNGGESWTKSGAASAKTASYSFTASQAHDGRMFKCQIKNSSGDIVTSEIAQLYLVDNQYTVTYDAGEGVFPDGSHTFINMTEQGPYYVECYDANGAILEPTREGYDFRGWKYNNRYRAYIKVLSDVTLVADWVAVYPVSYDANGGHFEYDFDGNDSWMIDAGYYINDTNDVLTMAHEAEIFYIPDYIQPYREGYNFIGWKLDGVGVSRVNVTGPKTLVAEWEQAIEVTYDANGGYWQFGDEERFYMHSEYQPAGYYLFGWHEPEHDSDEDGHEYRFDGWMIGNKRANGTNLTGPITVKAKWVKRLNITYDANGGYWEDSEENVREYTRVEQVDIGNGTWIGNATPENDDPSLVFLGWSTLEDAVCGNYGFGIDSVQGDLVYYAIWGVKDCIITLDGNGGNLSMNYKPYPT